VPTPVSSPDPRKREEAATQSSCLIVQSNPKLAASLKTFSRSAAAAAALIGVFGLLGWMFDIPQFKSIHPDLASRKANTAVCFLLAGIALWLLHKHVDRFVGSG
jgi:hypothetical protein